MSDHQAPVSVIIPCYGCVDTIERAVQSVAAQTLLPSELILVDDFSIDDTLTKLYELKHRYPTGWIKIIAQPSNKGPASARNAGWSAARNKYLAFLDSDDTWHPQKIEIQYYWMERHPDFALCGHDRVQSAEGEERLNIIYDRVLAAFSPVSKSELLIRNRFPTSSAMLRRDIISRFEDGKRYSEDYLLWLLIACSGNRMARCEAPLAFSYKAAFGSGGLSAQLWNMEKGELHTYQQIWRSRGTDFVSYSLLQALSIIRYLKRILISAIRK